MHNSGVFLQFESVKMIGKALIVIVALLVASTSAFRAPLSSRYSTSKSSLSMSKGSTAAKVATGILAAVLSANPAMAATTNFWGQTYSEVIDPKTATLNDETSSSDDAKAGAASLTEFRATLKGVRADLAKDGQTELNNRLKKELAVNKVRIGLNKFNTAFSEDTQRGTDRLIRAVVQDLTELDRETAIKAGKTRADTKVKAIEKRLKAAADALDELAAFAK